MKVHVERKWAWDGVEIYVFEQTLELGGVTRMYVPGDEVGTWATVDIPNGGPVERPTLRLPVPWLEAIVKEASNILPPSDAMSAHLRDTIGVRDRLLALVEAKVTA